jgi:molybdenum cofactor guanylyltransferase
LQAGARLATGRGLARDDGHVILRATLVVLAGGESRRMGRPKALLPVGTTTLIEWLVARLAPAFAHLAVAARDADRLPAGLRPHLVPDLHAGAGPLAGVEAGLAASPHDLVVAVACDMPAVTSDLLGRLAEAAAGSGADAAVPRVGGRPEPACAAYHRSAAGPIAEALTSGRHRAADALADLRVRWLDDEDPALFANLNTPEDYRRFLHEYASVPPVQP